MKYVIGIVLLFWLLCGLIGAWWLDDLHIQYWRVIAKGPITLARAYHEHSPGYPES